MTLLTKRERRMIRKSFKFSGNIVIGLISFVVSIIVLDIHLIVKGYKWLKNYIHYRKVNLSHLQIQKMICRMSGRQFEIFMYQLFKANNYKCKLTQASSDGGKDLIIYDNKRGKIYVEIKRYLGDWKVDRPTTQKLIGSAVGDGVKNTLFINTGIYTNEAIEYANKVNMELWNMNDIMDFVFKTPVSKLPFIMAQTFSTKGDDEILDKIEHFANSVEQYE